MEPELLFLFRKKKMLKRLYYVSLIQERPPRPLFDLDSIGNCKEEFRFEKEDILKLQRLLRIPFIMRCRTLKVDGLTALCMLLRRMAYPNRLCDLAKMFHRSKSDISIIVNHLFQHIMGNFGRLLDDLDQDWLSEENLQIFSESISQEGAPLQNCCGFIDGTLRQICRPTYMQWVVYNGHKRVHALKYQSVIAPNGLIANLFGPIEGRRHDSFMLAESDLIRRLRQKNQLLNRRFCLYGDPAYPLRDELIAPHRGANLAPEQGEFNRRMSMGRVVVEWAFGKVSNLFAFVDFKKNQKLFLQPVASHYKVAVILTNCHTCLYGSQVADKFGVDPPSLEDYLI